MVVTIRVNIKVFKVGSDYKSGMLQHLQCLNLSGQKYCSLRKTKATYQIWKDDLFHKF